MMTMDTVLTLQEQMLLLLLNDETGAFDGPYGSYGLNGAALAELLLQGRIALQEGTVMPVDATPTGNLALDVALERIHGNRRLESLDWWLRCLYPHTDDLQETLVTNLTRQGILWPEVIPMRWGVNLLTYPTLDPTPERHLRAQIRAALLEETEVTAHLAALIAVLQGCQALPLVLNWEERARSQARRQGIIAGHPVAQTIEAALSRVTRQDLADLYLSSANAPK